MYDADNGPTLRLGFDRAINAGSLHGNQITVDDGANLGLKFAATGEAGLEGPSELAVILVEIDNASQEHIILNASSATGIFAVDDGGTWPGVTNLSLPFP